MAADPYCTVLGALVMADTVSVEVRSRIMSSIRSKDTKPEMAVRRILWRRGFRYRVHDRTLPGTPDISNKRRKLAVFVDGCFWHGCPKCYSEPKTNADFWREKVRKNRARRDAVRTRLEAHGFRVVEIWEHEVDDEDTVVERVGYALEGRQTVAPWFGCSTLGSGLGRGGPVLDVPPPNDGVLPAGPRLLGSGLVRNSSCLT